MQPETAACAHIGARQEQQDRVAALSRNSVTLLVLADGMGGHEGGALAAQAVVDVARERFEFPPAEHPAQLLAHICHSAHERINAIGAQSSIAPHSTCVLLHLTAMAATWAHVGDSRLYRFRNGRLVGRTIDHSVVELMRLQGKLTEEMMKTHPDQNRLYQALGGSQPPEPEIDSASCTERDGFVLASDGLWENVADQDLEELFEAADLTRASSELIARARSRGGPDCDNLSVLATRWRSARPSLARRLRRTWIRQRLRPQGHSKVTRYRLRLLSRSSQPLHNAHPDIIWSFH